MYLIIENSYNDKSVVALGEGDKIIKKLEKKRSFKESENLLELIHELLSGKKIKPKDLEGIIVITGPGSFTALRIACVIANTFAYVEKVPLFGFKKTEYNKLEDLLKKTAKKKGENHLEPFYNKKPNISKPKKKK
ncbi:MAG: tRNA (adenosine(37)-N6)-threonylcarbamoyltransferase complex dimerization subunit type 1 TsaB [Patescibacteria group bacterium]|nr:tRNA (adenosine(37)-N6)-threonylcarbamoyltransferase complex dimerization subunit type 1 TsaB [Patescibacteria group bacterium]